MITFTNDLGDAIIMTEEELKQEAIDMIGFAVKGKEYSIHDLDTEWICQDISGHTTKLTKEQFSNEARSIVHHVLNDMKKYQCTHCNNTSNANEWNKTTIKYFGMSDILPIEKAIENGDIGGVFKCPNCNTEMHTLFFEIIKEEK